jgi:hypothetical protein
VELRETTWSDHRLINAAALFISFLARADASHLNIEPTTMHLLRLLVPMNELYAGLFRCSRCEHGQCPSFDEGARSSHGPGVRVDTAIHDRPISTTAVMYWAAFIYHFLVASEISMLGTSLPLVMTFAKAHEMNPLLLGMIWTFAAGGKLFAYQSGALIVGCSYGHFDARNLLRLGWWLTVVEFLVLLVLVPLY